MVVLGDDRLYNQLQRTLENRVSIRMTPVLRSASCVFNIEFVPPS